MKISEKILLSASVVVVLFTSCVKGANESDFYGKWQNRREDGILTIDISVELLKGQYDDAIHSYTIEGLTWRSVINNDPVTKDEYPSGYYINGTVTQENNISDLYLGQQMTYEFYMSKDKVKLYRKINQSGASGNYNRLV